MQRKSLVTRAGCAVLLALTACQDLPTAVVPSTPTPRVATQSGGGLHLGQTPLVCVLGRPAPAPATGWQTRRDTIFLPRSEYDARGPMVRYFFWRLAPGGGIAHTASCTVPYSEAALRRVDRHFGVEQGGGADQFVVRQGMLTTQTCVTDENVGCVLDPVTVTAPPRENSDPCEARPHECTNKYGGGSEDWWSDPNSWGGGGGGGDSGLPGDDDDDGDTLDQGPVAYTLCIALKLSAGGWSAIGGTVVSAAMAWDARKGTRDAYDAWAGYRQNVENGVVQYDPHINDLYHKRWKDAEHQEYLLYVAAGAAGVWAATEIFRAAALCAPLGAAPVP